MSSPRDAAVYLADILDAAEDAQRFVEGLSKDDFLEDRKSVFAVIRAIEVMGEAAKRVPVSVRTSMTSRQFAASSRGEAYDRSAGMPIAPTSSDSHQGLETRSPRR